MTTDPQNLLPGLHESMRLLKQNDLDYGPGRILERIKELGGEQREFWVVVSKTKGYTTYCPAVYLKPVNVGNDYEVIHCREVV